MMSPDTQSPPPHSTHSPMGKFYLHKWTTFASMYVGYMLTVLNRKSFSFAVPAMALDGLTKHELGLIASSQNLAYTGSKFLGGIVSDRMSPRVLFSLSLFMTGLMTITFTGFHSVFMFALVWFIHGAVQGGTWPACAKMLRHWAFPSELGMLWSTLSTSMNVACSVGPLLATFIILHFGWRYCLIAFGVVTIIASVAGYFILVDSPTDVGYESFAEKAKTDTEKGRVRGRGTWQDMVRSPFMWTLCVAYMVVFAVRTAALDWGQLYLIQEVGHAQYTGSIFISSLEIGGIVGSIAAGYVGDKLVVMNPRDDIRGTPRMTLAVAFVVLYISALHSLIFLISSHTSQTVIALIGLCLGCGLYGPVTIYGVMAIEAAPSHLSGTSSSIVAFSANVGSILAGLPFSYIARRFHWRGAFIVLESLSIGILLMKLVTRNLEYKMVAVRKKLE